MQASAVLTVEAGAGAAGRARTRVTCLRSDPPLVLRPTLDVGRRRPGAWPPCAAATAHVALVAGAAGPIGGDHLHLDVDVGPGAALTLAAVAATIALPGPHGDPSLSEVTVRVAADATLVWLPGTLIAAHGCRHESTTAILLEPGARLVLREELVLGRHGEEPGDLRQRLRVVRGDRPLLDHEVRIGSGAPGWAGPAVTGGRRAYGSALVVDPSWDAASGGAPPPVDGSPDSALLPLDGPAVLVTALARDVPTLRSRLDAHLSRLICVEKRAAARGQPVLAHSVPQA
jgi:urease accessory protein